MLHYKIGRIDGRWINLVPPIQLDISETTLNKEPGKESKKETSKYSPRIGIRREQSMVLESLQQHQNNVIGQSQIVDNGSLLEPHKPMSSAGRGIPRFTHEEGD
jgi:hypothetical protein